MYDRETGKLLRNFGVGNTYRGFPYCVYSIKLVIEDPNTLNNVTKCVYPEVARKYKTSCKCIERDIRTVAEIVWKNGGMEFFYRVTGRLIETRPTNTKFLELLAYCVTSDEQFLSWINPSERYETCRFITDYKIKITKLEIENQKMHETINWMHELIWELIGYKKGEDGTWKK